MEKLQFYIKELILSNTYYSVVSAIHNMILQGSAGRSVLLIQ
jgi:hypothetical protein